MKKTAILVMLITVLVKLAGMLREVALSYYYGATSITDAYLISLTIPSTIFAFIGTALATSFIPIYNDIKARESLQNADKFTTHLVSMILILCTIMIIIVYSFPEIILRAFASGFDATTMSQAVLFTKIGIVSIYASALVFVFTSYLQVKESFIPAIFSGLVVSCLVIISTILSSKYGTIYLSIGSSLSIFLQFLCMYPYIKKQGFSFSFRLKINDGNIKKLLFLSIPVIIGVSVNQINVLINKTIASNVSVGGISALTYADKLNMFLQGIFVMSLVTVFYPLISKYVVEKKSNQLKTTLSDVIVSISLFMIPASIGTIFFSKQFVELIYGRGAFSSEAVDLTSSALLFYSIGMLAFGLREVLSRVYYAMHDTKTPMINAGIGMLINIVLNLILSRFLGIGGLALGTSLSAIVTTLLLYGDLRKKIGDFNHKYLIIVFIKLISSSIIMGIVAKLTYISLVNYMNINLSFVIAIMVGVILYSFFIIVLKIQEVQVIIKSIKRKLNFKGGPSNESS